MILSRDEYFHEIPGVFFVVAFCAYNWSLFILLWQLPSLLLSLDVGDIIGFAAYQLMFAFIESVFITAMIALVARALPARYFRKNLLVSGSLLALSLALISAYFRALPSISDWIFAHFSITQTTAVDIAYGSWVYLMILLPILSALLARDTRVASAVRRFVENLSLLVGVYIVLSIIGIIVVVARNIY